MRLIDAVCVIVAVTLLSGMMIESSVVAAIPRGQRETPREKNIWDGVYTATQATRGGDQYRVHCSECHGGDLRGGSGRGLVGSRFWERWGENSLGSLFELIRTAMPREAPQSLSNDTYLDIVAYLLEKNDYPSGNEELTATHLRDIRIIRKDGPGPVPNFALVTVVGCLSGRSGDVWVLARSSEPVRTRNPDGSEGEERQRAEEVPPGIRTFELIHIYRAPTGHEDHKVEVKGFLNRGATDRLSVTSIQMIDSKCEQ